MSLITIGTILSNASGIIDSVGRLVKVVQARQIDVTDGMEQSRPDSSTQTADLDPKLNALQADIASLQERLAAQDKSLLEHIQVTRQLAEQGEVLSQRQHRLWHYVKMLGLVCCVLIVLAIVILAS